VFGASNPRPLRWLVVGELGTSERVPFTVGPGELPARLGLAGVRVAVDVPDRLGGETSRRFELGLPKLRAFGVEALMQSSPLLHELAALGRHVSKQQMLPAVERLLGRGRLYAALDATSGEGAAEPVRDPNERSLHELLQVVTQPPPNREAAAVRAIDVFVRAARVQRPSVVPTIAKPSRPAHLVLAEMLTANAREVLAQPEVAALERAWRGLKLLADQLPADGSIVLEVADAAPEHALDVLEMRAHGDPGERPDLVLWLGDVRTAERLRACAARAEALETVCVLAFDPALIGADSLDGVRREREGRAGRELAQLLAAENMRWLCLAANPVLVHAEDQGDKPAQRTEADVNARRVFASPVLGFAALLTAAQRERGRFSRVLAPELLLRAPTFWIPSKGPDAGMALPTAEFCSVRAQHDLAALGITALGSTRRGDELLASAVPTAFTGAAAQSLPAQLLIGRIVRTVRGLLDQLPDNADDAFLQDRLRALCSQPLAPGLGSAVALDAQVEQPRQGRCVRVLAKADKTDAITPFEIGFTLGA
jgi:hypothetical protein